MRYSQLWHRVPYNMIFVGFGLCKQRGVKGHLEVVENQGHFVIDKRNSGSLEGEFLKTFFEEHFLGEHSSCHREKYSWTF